MRRRHAILILAALGFFTVGCARTSIDHSLATDYPRTDATASLDFWHDLAGRPAISNDEGLHGVLVLMAGQDPTMTYPDRLALLRREGWIPRNFDEAPDLAMQRGTLAKAVAEAIGVKGGVMYRVTGARRYADRELVALNLMPPGTELQAVSGSDFLGIITRAQGYAMLKGVQVGSRSFGEAPAAAEPPAELPPPAAPSGPLTPEPRPARDGDVDWVIVPLGAGRP